jgi:glycine/D-amino acid oxidase-like deaminating enzyme
LPSEQHHDVVVCGAGTAGAIAAIAAARTGARTLVVEQYGRVGGLLNAGMSLNGAADFEGYKALGGIGGELFDRLKNLGAATRVSLHPYYASVVGHNPELTQLVLLSMLKDAGVEFLLHSFVVDVLTVDERARAILVANKSALETIHAGCFVDCTGDADVVARGHGQFVIGRPSDSLTQPVTLLFRMGGVNLARLWEHMEAHPEDMAPPDNWGRPDIEFDARYLRTTPGITVYSFQNLIRKAREEGAYSVPHDRIAIDTFPGSDVVTINATRVHGVDATDARQLTRAEIETELQMLEVIRFLRERAPGFENSRLVSVPFQLGVRETRRIVGSYVITTEDILGGRDFEDRIGRGAYPFDVHDVKRDAVVLGTTVKGSETTLAVIRRSYSVPMRSLIPLGVDRVVVGGRSISATHEAQSSVRGQAVCMVTGHAAGTIAALAALRDVSPASLGVEEVQSTLLGQNAILDRTVKIAAE